MGTRPTGTVTFLFTDIEGSTKLAREHAETWELARARHHDILREAIEFNHGFVFQIIGDAFCVAFHKAGDALRAAIRAQQVFQSEHWEDAIIRVRMGIHTGEAEVQDNDYIGYQSLSLVQRVMASGHGGQILISGATENLLRGQVSPEMSLIDLGRHNFKDVPQAVRIFQLITPGLQIDFPPLRTFNILPNNLPAQLTSFIGREKELEDVKKLLQDTHLLSLIGPGGTGKTRLAIEAAGNLLDQYPDGVWLVELARILDPALVPRTTAIAIGLRDEPQRPIIDMLCDYLQKKKMLILLDNCEHLVDACAQMSDRILHVATNVRILASSREALGIAGEVTYRVPSLKLPNVKHLPAMESVSQYEAVKLFIDRATSAVPTFSVTNENAPALAEICHRLDGIPLAIELAAAKVRVLSVDEIAKRLDNRFRLLTGGSRTALERHQTLRATVDWSYNLLPPEEQVLLRRLSVFIGSWRLESAELVCSDESTSSVIRDKDILYLLEQLINKSLVITEEAGHESRYHMLETIRQYANEKLVESGESDHLRDMHLEYFLTLAETAEPHLIRPEQLEWLLLLEADHDNLRLACEWALSKDTAEPSLKMCVALEWFWKIRCYWLEGLNFVRRALAKPFQNESVSEKVTRARALSTHASLEWQLGNFDQILSPAQASLALASEVSDKKAIAIARYYVGIALRGKDNEQAISLMEQSFSDFQALQEEFWQAFSFQKLGDSLVGRAKMKYRDSTLKTLELARNAGERLVLADALWGYAHWLFINNQTDEALEYAKESEQFYKQIGSENINLNSMLFAEAAWLAGDYQKARSFYLESLERLELLGEKAFRSICSANLGLLSMEEGDLDRARNYLEQSLVLSREIGHAGFIAQRLIELGGLFYRQGNIEGFRKNAREGLSFRNYFNESHKIYLMIAILNSLCIERPESCAHIIGTIDYFYRENDFQLDPIDKRFWDSAETHARQTLGDAVFESAFAEGQKVSLDEALDLVLKIVEEMKNG